MNPDTWKLVASIGGVLITVVTGPIIWAIRAEAGRIRTEMKLVEAQIKLTVTTQIAEAKLDLTTQMGELKTHMTEIESRLNARIDTRLVHR